MSKVDSVVTDVCPTSVYSRSEQHVEVLWGGQGGYATLALGAAQNMVSRTKITRYGIDLETSPSGATTLFQIQSANANVNPIHRPLLDVEYRTFDFYGAALGGPRWAGFDTLLIPDFVSTSSFERFDESLSVYLVWQNSSATGALQKLSPAIPLNQASWWGTTGFTHSDFVITVKYDPLIDVEYHSCPAGQGLQQYTLNSNGTLTVRDLKFGGIGSRVRIELRAVDPNPMTSMVRVIVLQWDNPGTYFDAELGQNVNAAPTGVNPGIVTIGDSIFLDPPAAKNFKIRLPTRIVEWVSTDIAGYSIRAVDSSDLAQLSAQLGSPVSWGFNGGTRNYHVNVNMFGATSALYIDASDLAMMVTDLGESCGGSSKATGSETITSEKDKILAWFGIAATGENVPAGPTGELIPGYEIVDLAQNRRAIADPFGWKNQQP